LVNFERLGNQQQLSIAMDLSKVTIGAMLHVLERNGLVMRGVSKKDRREKLIHVTPEGVAALDRAREIAREADKAILASLGTEGIMVTERVLRQTNEVIRDLMNNSAIKTEITSG
jgi:DNA-binding MarR family transcriptional regulator